GLAPRGIGSGQPMGIRAPAAESSNPAFGGGGTGASREGTFVGGTSGSVAGGAPGVGPWGRMNAVPGTQEGSQPSRADLRTSDSRPGAGPVTSFDGTLAP